MTPLLSFQTESVIYSHHLSDLEKPFCHLAYCMKANGDRKRSLDLLTDFLWDFKCHFYFKYKA